MSDTNGHSGNGQPASQYRRVVPRSANETLRPEKAVQPPRRSRRARSQMVIFLNFILSAMMFVAVAGGVAFWYGKTRFEEPGPLTASKNILIRPSTGLGEIGQQLERLGMVSDGRIFQYGVRAYGNESALKAGEYEVKAGASMRQIMDLLKSGKSVLYALTIPEGLTVEQAWQRIASDEVLTGDMPAEMPGEGEMLADTIRFTRGTTRQEIIDKLVADQKSLVEQVWQRRDPDVPVKDMNEFVTLASIVEKETAIADERTRVAAVFANRLRKGMRLQSDPTIIYGIFGGAGKPKDRPIYKSDIEKPTPYNTYTIDGLPPGPIAIPGRDSLEAVANPSETDDLYFVADGTGGHVFATTLEEHNENVQRWRQIEKQKAEEAAKAANGGNGQGAGN